MASATGTVLPQEHHGLLGIHGIVKPWGAGGEAQVQGDHQHRQGDEGCASDRGEEDGAGRDPLRDGAPEVGSKAPTGHAPPPNPGSQSYYKAKYLGPDGQVIYVTHTGWVGTD